MFFFRWYFGKIKRIEAEKKLLLPENEHGAFLIRDSESRRNDYSLSVRDGDTVKHYRIRQLDDGNNNCNLPYNAALFFFLQCATTNTCSMNRERKRAQGHHD